MQENFAIIKEKKYPKETDAKKKKKKSDIKEENLKQLLGFKDLKEKNE